MLAQFKIKECVEVVGHLPHCLHLKLL